MRIELGRVVVSLLRLLALDEYCRVLVHHAPGLLRLRGRAGDENRQGRESDDRFHWFLHPLCAWCAPACMVICPLPASREDRIPETGERLRARTTGDASHCCAGPGKPAPFPLR
jgi:hypothetical protein